MAERRHFLSLLDLTREDYERLFDLTHRIETDEASFADALTGKLLGTMFFDSSTRTRISFEAAMLKLGGKVTGFADHTTTRASGFFGESFEDTVRVLGQYCHCLVFRHPRKQTADLARRLSPVPVVNGGNGHGEHPSQTLLDLYTIRRHFGRLEGLRVGIMGSPNVRNIHSLYFGLSRFKPIELFFLSPDDDPISGENREYLNKESINCSEVATQEELMQSCDAVYVLPYHVPSYSEAGDDISNSCHLDVPERFRITREKFERIDHDVMLLACGPRGQEIAADMDDLPALKMFEQVRNGLHARMAILLELLA